MAKLGWSPVEVDQMDIPTAGRLLGVGGGDPVIRGGQSVQIASGPNLAGGGDPEAAFGQPSAATLARIEAGQAAEQAARETDGGSPGDT